MSTLNVPATGNNTVTCGTNITLYDNGGSAGNYANSSNGYTVLEAGLGATINISGSYVTEGVDYIRFYNGVGTGGTLLAAIELTKRCGADVAGILVLMELSFLKMVQHLL